MQVRNLLAVFEWASAQPTSGLESTWAPIPPQSFGGYPPIFSGYTPPIAALMGGLIGGLRGGPLNLLAGTGLLNLYFFFPLPFPSGLPAHNLLAD